MSDSPKHAAGGVVATWVRLVAVTVIGLLQAPILFSKIPPAELGVWYLFFAVATFINLSDLGLAATFGRAVSYLRGRGQSPDGSSVENLPALYRGVPLAELYASAFAATALLGVALALLTLPAALLYFSRALPAGPSQPQLLVPLLVFLAGAVVNLAAAIPGACLSGCGEVGLDNGVRTAANVIGFGLIWIFVPLHRSLTALCVIYLVQGTIALLASHLALVFHRWVTQAQMRINVGLVRGLHRESAPIFASRIGSWLTVEATLLIAGYFLGPARLADFGLLRQMVAIGASVVAAIPIAISPQVSAAHAAGDDQRVRNLYAATLRYALVANVLWTLGLLLWAPNVIGLLVGEQHFLGTAVLVPLVIASLLELHAMTHAFFIWNVGRWPFVPSTTAGGILNLVLASAGCALFGYAGLAWGSMAAQALTGDWYQVVYALRHMGITFGQYCRNTLLRAAAYAAALGAVALGLRLVARPLLTGDRYFAMGGAGAAILATALLAAALAWKIMLTPGDRGYFLGLMKLSSR